MPEVPLIATKDFTYNTRRLMAGDEFAARNPMDARILERVRRVAKQPEPEAPDARVKEVVAPRILTTEEVLEAKVVEEKPKAKPRKAKAGARARKAKAKK